MELLREGVRPLVFEGVRRTADADMRTLLANLQVQPARCLGTLPRRGLSAVSAHAWLIKRVSAHARPHAAQALARTLPACAPTPSSLPRGGCGMRRAPRAQAMMEAERAARGRKKKKKGAAVAKPKGKQPRSAARGSAKGPKGAKRRKDPTARAGRRRAPLPASVQSCL